jgi:hypothetical protein
MLDLTTKRYLAADERIFPASARTLASYGLPVALHGRTAATLPEFTPAITAYLNHCATSRSPLYLHGGVLSGATHLLAASAHLCAGAHLRALYLHEADVFDALLDHRDDPTQPGKGAIIAAMSSIHTLLFDGLGTKLGSLSRTDWFAGELADIVRYALHRNVRLVVTASIRAKDLADFDALGQTLLLHLRETDAKAIALPERREYRPAPVQPCPCPVHLTSVAEVMARFPILSAGEALAFCDDYQLPPYYDQYTAQQLAAPDVLALTVPRLSDTTIPALSAPVRNRSADLLALSRQLGRASSGTCRQTGKDAAVCETRPFWQNGVMRQQHIANWHSVEPVEQEAVP